MVQPINRQKQTPLREASPYVVSSECISFEEDDVNSIAEEIVSPQQYVPPAGTSINATPSPVKRSLAENSFQLMRGPRKKKVRVRNQRGCRMMCRFLGVTHTLLR